MRECRFFTFAYAGALFLVCGWGGLRAAEVSVPVELERLAAAHGFDIVGAEHLEDAKGWTEGAQVLGRLRLLLDRFDHIIVQKRGGGVERVIILGKANPAAAQPRAMVRVEGDSEVADAESAAGDIVLETIRKGNQHSVRVALESTNGERVERVLLVDTGADSVVLPTSLIQTLGIAKERLEEREVQTANGRVGARIGTLPGLWLGNQRVGVVAVAFIDDGKLGNAGLLGMSVLGRYQMTIDDDKGSLRLTRR